MARAFGGYALVRPHRRLDDNIRCRVGGPIDSVDRLHIRNCDTSGQTPGRVDMKSWRGTRIRGSEVLVRGSE